MILTLDSLKEGQIGIVKRVWLPEKKQAKLSHLGLVKHACIQNRFSSVFGSPIAYQIHGTIFALRKEDAKKIEVEV